MEVLKRAAKLAVWGQNYKQIGEGYRAWTRGLETILPSIGRANNKGRNKWTNQDLSDVGETKLRIHNLVEGILMLEMVLSRLGMMGVAFLTCVLRGYSPTDNLTGLGVMVMFGGLQTVISIIEAFRIHAEVDYQKFSRTL